ncbi:MAG TPA: hypothetical protein DEQ38_00770 [Elusimicrobia bacterium]|nr:MAG: hypothetical protein A2089_09805 [Elusimicrobia bacterium GWD2_63_28]HCC46644.1 hypothetical protein [Elusimicrobiota bacterium]
MNLVEFYRTHAAREEADFRFLALKELLKKNISGTSVLDIGCGTGAMLRALARDGYAVSGVEPDPELYALAQELKDREGLDFKLVNAGMQSVSSETMAGFSTFLLLDVLEHVEDEAALLRRIWDGMPPGSTLLCLLPALRALYGRRDASVGHFRRYDMADAKALFGAVPFSGAAFSYWNLLGVPAYWFFEKVARRPVPEGFRREGAGRLKTVLNSLLLRWFLAVENRVSPPAGLSILIKAVK